MSTVLKDKPYLAIHLYLLEESDLEDELLANKFIEYLVDNPELIKYSESTANRWQASVGSSTVKAELSLLHQSAKLKNKRITPASYRESVKTTLTNNKSLNASLIQSEAFRESDAGDLPEELIEKFKELGTRHLPKSYWQEKWRDLDTPDCMLKAYQELKEADKDEILAEHLSLLSDLPIIADTKDRIKAVLRSGNYTVTKALMAHCKFETDSVRFFDELDFEGLEVVLSEKELKLHLLDSIALNPNISKIPKIERLLNPSPKTQVMKYGGFYSVPADKIIAPQGLKRSEVKKLLKDKGLMEKLIKGHPKKFGELCGLLTEFKVKWDYGTSVELYSLAVRMHRPNAKYVPSEIKNDRTYIDWTR